jgi:cysteine desulfurase/selenocysteine lyase
MAEPMERKPLYFDNAATSYPKPEAVYQACDRALRCLGNPGRGGHRLALDAARTMFEGREAVGAFLGAPSERLVFTGGCTVAINLVLNGLVGAARLGRGDTVLCTSYEHNAVMRPLHWLGQHHGIKHTKIAPSDRHCGLIDLSDFERLLKTLSPRLCILSLASNVSGEILDIAGASQLCQEHGVPLLIDAAQATGSIPFSLTNYPAISFFATSAHKGLLGPPGLGVLYVGQGESLDPSLCGGTGSRSESLEMPQFLPDRLEPGTPGVHLVAGLAAAIGYLGEKAETIREHEAALSRHFIDRLAAMPQIKVHGRNVEKNDQQSHLATFALSIEGLSADRVADRLDQDHDMAVRPGLHCAVSAHETLGTRATGLVRVSFGAFNKKVEIDKLSDALAALVEKSKSAV